MKNQPPPKPVKPLTNDRLSKKLSRLYGRLPVYAIDRAQKTAEENTRKIRRP